MGSAFITDLDISGCCYIALKVSFSEPPCFPSHGLLINRLKLSHGETRVYKEGEFFTMYFNPEIDQDMIYTLY